MQIFYTASYYGKDEYQKNYDMVLKAIQATKVDIISPELGNYQEVLPFTIKDKYQNDPKFLHYESIKRGIQVCDGVIIEISQEDFQLGHEATLAIQNHTHVLCLSIHEDYSTKIKNPYFWGAKYNQFNIEELVENFVNTVKYETLNKRFNMFLTASQLAYLDERSKATSSNKSEYLRKLLEEDRKLNITS